MGSPWSGIRAAYLARLTAAGALRAEPGGLAGRTRWRVTDAGRVARARARLDTVASSHDEVGLADAALGGLAHAISLDQLLYPGRRGHLLRDRLAALAAGPRPAGVPLVPAPRLTEDVVDLAGLGVLAAAGRAATHSAARAAASAAHQAGEYAAHHADTGHHAVVTMHLHP